MEMVGIDGAAEVEGCCDWGWDRRDGAGAGGCWWLLKIKGAELLAQPSNWRHFRGISADNLTV